MDDKELMPCIKEILGDYSDIPLSEMSDDSDLFADLALNSLDLVNIVGVFEDRFGIKILDNDLANFRTIGDIKEYLNRLI